MRTEKNQRRFAPTKTGRFASEQVAAFSRNHRPTLSEYAVMTSKLIRSSRFNIVTYKREPTFVEVNLNGMEEDQMKKLVIFVLISALLTLTAAMALAHDDDNNFKKFRGTYKMIASGSCIHSEEGWVDANGDENSDAKVPPFYPINPSKVYVGNTVTSGTWIFNKGGTGTYTITNYATILPGSGFYPTTDPFLKTQKPPAQNFDFTVSPSGDITVKTGGIELVGIISIDKKVMTLINGNQVQYFGTGLWWTVCNSARTLIKVSD